MTLPDAVREAVEHAVAGAPSGEDLLAATLRRERPHRWLPVVAAAAAVVAIAVGVTVVQTRDHASAPTVPATDAQTALDGLRMTLQLDRSSARVGDLVHAKASVTNTRSTPVRFGGGSCQAPENQPNVDVDLRPGQPRGRGWTGTAAEAKAAALEKAPYTGTFAAKEGQTACLDYYRTWTLDPGRTLTVPDVVWRARTPYNSAYDGSGTVRAVFRYTLRADEQVPHELAVQLPLHVTGGDPGVLSPAAAVDRALSDPAFAAFVDANPPSTWSPDGPGSGITTMPFYRDAAGRLVHQEVWQVYLRRNVNARYGSVTIDPRTGAILARDLPPAAGLQPADSQTPAAGTCGMTTGPVATVELNPDVPGPRCLIVRADQRLRVVNTTNRAGSPGEVVTLRWPPFAERQLAIGASTTYDRPLGDYLAPGVHRLDSNLYAGSGPEIWLKP
jgi:hypothetical protein